MQPEEAARALPWTETRNLKGFDVSGVSGILPLLIDALGAIIVEGFVFQSGFAPFILIDECISLCFVVLFLAHASVLFLGKSIVRTVFDTEDVSSGSDEQLRELREGFAVDGGLFAFPITNGALPNSHLFCQIDLTEVHRLAQLADSVCHVIHSLIRYGDI